MARSKQLLGVLAACTVPCHDTGALVELGLLERVLAERRRALERTLRLGMRAERAGTLGGTDEHLSRAPRISAASAASGAASSAST